MITAVVLAAGDSSRMGSPKALLNIKGKTFLEAIISNLKVAGLQDIVVVLGKDRNEVLKKWMPSEEKVVFNDKPYLGQLYSLRLAIKEIPDSDIMLCLVDQPLIKPETYKRIVIFSAMNPKAIIIPKCLKDSGCKEKKFKRGHPILIPNCLCHLCLNGPLEKGLHWVTHHPDAPVAEVEVSDTAILMDFDTPQEYTRLFEGSSF